MTLDEALTEAMQGGRVTALHLQSGCYVEHSFARGYLRCWSVDTPDDEPNRTQCDFIADAADIAAEWRILERNEQYPPKPKLVGGWGEIKRRLADPSPPTHTPPPVADVIDLSPPKIEWGPSFVQAPPVPVETWAKPLDPMKGGW